MGKTVDNGHAYECDDIESATESSARSAARESMVKRMVEQGKKFGSEPIGGEAGIRKYVEDVVAGPSDVRIEEKKRKKGL